MVTGFKDDKGIFHPLTKYNGVRKSRDQTAKTQGIRLKRDDGFKGDARIYIAKETAGGWSRGGKPAPRKEIVSVIRDLWNNDPAFKKMRKHVDYLTIQYSENVTNVGRWNPTEKKLTVFDNGTMSPDDFKSLFVHEVIGHVFWDLARKWRREELVEFNRLANSLPPVNSYVQKNEEEWKKMSDEYDDYRQFEKSISHIPEWDPSQELAEEYETKLKAFEEKRKSNSHDTMTRYANEQHSAVTEIIYGYDYFNRLIDETDLSKLVNAWEKLHY